MKRRIHQRASGFTLIEIMIVVTIIALLAAIGMPNFFRARKRAQATRMVDDLRLIDNAIDLYATENSKGGGDPAGWVDVQPYLKKNIVLYNSNGIDLLGNRINETITFSVDSVPKVNSLSYSALSDVAPRDFWSPYDPQSSASSSPGSQVAARFGCGEMARSRFGDVPPTMCNGGTSCGQSRLYNAHSHIVPLPRPRTLEKFRKYLIVAGYSSDQ